LLLIAGLIYLIGITAEQWEGAYRPAVEIDLSGRSLVLYSLFSMGRALIAYLLSLSFTIFFGYAAAKNRFAERLIIPLLDIGQSIPVLGFLPGLVLGLVSIFPKTNIGLELACIIMIFTGQVWNMAFSFISSMKSVPTQLHEMAEITGLSTLRTFFRVELPCTATGLAWNSLMSVAGGWFFLTVCEAFTLGEKNFRLPGLGSYMSVAIDQGDHRAMLFGIVSMITVIFISDFVIWRPVIAWTSKFRLSESHDDFQTIPFMTLLFRDSWLAQQFTNYSGLLVHNWTRFYRRIFGSRLKSNADSDAASSLISKNWMVRFLKREQSVSVLVYAAALFISWKLFHFVETLDFQDWREILIGAGLTGIRVLSAVILGTLWALPAGILIGLSPRLTRLLQPLIQVGASFPAPMIYPLALGIFAWLKLPIAMSSALLMLLGVQWYILFNVLAGAVTISGDLTDSFKLIGVRQKTLWLKLYLPSVFPYLVTGWVTAAGGAWNASIVSEYISYGGQPLIARGLGSMISESTSQGNYPRLVACLMVMVATVLLINRSLWRRVYAFAETRFRFER
jgi:NitT/TauT family transport system permease protein